MDTPAPEPVLDSAPAVLECNINSTVRRCRRPLRRNPRLASDRMESHLVLFERDEIVTPCIAQAPHDPTDEAAVYARNHSTDSPIPDRRSRTDFARLIPAF